MTCFTCIFLNFDSDKKTAYKKVMKNILIRHIENMVQVLWVLPWLYMHYSLLLHDLMK